MNPNGDDPMEQFELTIRCKICGSANVKLTRESDYVSRESWHDDMEYTGNIELTCECGMTEVLYVAAV